jgi:hypothetical protein
MTATNTSEQLLTLIHFLRGRGLAISPSESLEAIQAASLVGYRREVLKTALRAVLAKSTEEGILFEEGFDLFFTHRALSNTPPQGDTGSADSLATTERILQEASDQTPEIARALRETTVQQLLQNDTGGLSLALEQAAAVAQVKGIKLFTQRGQYVRKILDQLGDPALREALQAVEGHDERAAERLQQLRGSLLNMARDTVERAYLLLAHGDNEADLERALEQVKLAHIAPHQRARMKVIIARLVRKLAARHGQRRRKKRRGQLHVAKTLRQSLVTDAIPFEPKWRHKEKKRPQIFTLCDVSGSVSAYASFLLQILYALQDVLPRTRSFAFSSHLGEVSELFDTLDIDTAVAQTLHRYGGPTDYGRALRDFQETALKDVNRRTTVIILGDARNNNGDFRLDILADIKQRSRQVIWLNPESRRAWGSGDSDILPVRKHCHIVKECNTLKQLERIVDTLLAHTR